MPQMDIAQIYKNAKDQGRTLVSFEVFPPKGDLPLAAAEQIAVELSDLKPDFMSVTYSAAGSGNSEATTEVASIIQEKHEIPVMAHLTCIGKTPSELDEQIADYKQRGIQNVLALRGDPMPGASESPFKFAKDLIKPLKGNGFTVGAAAYTEGHIDCLDLDEDIEHLKQKQDAGADFFITQLFFDNEHFQRFMERAAKAGITVPVFAGVMPFMSKSQIQRMIFTCGASLPAPIIKFLAKYEDDPDSLQQAGIEYAASQLTGLVNNGASGIHLYTMNKPEITRQIVQTVRSECASCSPAQ